VCRMEEFDDNLPHRQFDNFQFVRPAPLLQPCVPDVMFAAQYEVGRDCLSGPVRPMLLPRISVGVQC
jgi:hypothetical protein